MSGYRRFPVCLAALVALAACVPRAAPPAPQPAPPLRPVPAPAPAPPRPPVPPGPPAAWQDGPLAPGDWSYSGAGASSQASFAAPGGMVFALRCDAARQIRIFRPGVPDGPITIVTSFGERSLPGAGNDRQAQAALPASDPLFDQIVFSRGRFLVRVAGGADLVLPTWPEPARLIEECRA
jgi:hypothetical protein